jgi:PLD-like domain
VSIRAWRSFRSLSGARLRTLVLLSALAVTFGLVVGPADAITVDRDSNGSIALPSGDECPTIATPAPYEAWFNIADMEKRGFVNPDDNAPWDYYKYMSQIICGAAKNSEIKIGMFFIRALGTMQEPSPGTVNALGDRPETDPEVVYNALQWVKTHRDVKVGLVLDGGTIMPGGEKTKVSQRLQNIADVYYCSNGCFNVNKAKVWPYAINHEKFLSISDTIWDGSGGTHPAILSMSGNFARSQLRNYHQETTLIYDDHTLYNMFDARYDAMKYCATKNCPSASGFPASMKLTKQRGIWVDPIYRHYTDAGRGTTVSFTPATQDARDFYVQQFDDVDCTVDTNIRIAMFKLTDAKAEQMVAALTRLRQRGCDISMLLTYQGGSTTISPKVVKALKKADIPTRCTTVAMHTKMILIGPKHSSLGRVLMGTQNMSVAGLRYSEEHVITLDTRAASAKYLEPMRRVYSQYMNGWYELSKDTRSCS